jgi:hypothetical protein
VDENAKVGLVVGDQNCLSLADATASREAQPPTRPGEVTLGADPIGSEVMSQ